MKRLFWFIFGIISVKWLSPIVESFARTIVAYNGLILQDIGREEMKSQSYLEAEYPSEMYTPYYEEYYEDDDYE